MSKTGEIIGKVAGTAGGVQWGGMSGLMAGGLAGAAVATVGVLTGGVGLLPAVAIAGGGAALGGIGGSIAGGYLGNKAGGAVGETAGELAKDPAIAEAGAAAVGAPGMGQTVSKTVQASDSVLEGSSISSGISGGRDVEGEVSPSAIAAEEEAKKSRTR